MWRVLSTRAATSAGENQQHGRGGNGVAFWRLPTTARVGARAVATLILDGRAGSEADTQGECGVFILEESLKAEI